VKVANLTFDLGSLEYEQVPVSPPNGLPQRDQIIIGVCVAAFFFIVFIIVIVILVRFNRMSSRKNREYRQLLSRLNALESGVRDQCKQGENILVAQPGERFATRILEKLH